MKAIRPIVGFTAACAAMLLNACVGPQPIRITVAPGPVIEQDVIPLPVPTDWHDQPATPGDWRWRHEGNASVARFGSPQSTLFSLTCDQGTRMVMLARATEDGVSISMTIRTTSLSRHLQSANSSLPGIAAHDPLLDAMAFSRGRFAVAAVGQELYLPSGPEVSRVIEDCRR